MLYVCSFAEAQAFSAAGLAPTSINMETGELNLSLLSCDLDHALP